MILNLLQSQISLWQESKTLQTLRTHFSKKLTISQLGKMHKTNTTQELGLTFTEFPQERILMWLSIFHHF